MYEYIVDSIFFSADSGLVLHRESLIHTDLKPENILLVHNDYHIVNIPVPGKVLISQIPQCDLIFKLLSQKNAAPKSKRILDSTEIRLIDFGSATFEKEYHSQVVSTRHYRAPEIILGLSSLLSKAYVFMYHNQVSGGLFLAMCTH